MLSASAALQISRKSAVKGLTHRFLRSSARRTDSTPCFDLQRLNSSSSSRVRLQAHVPHYCAVSTTKLNFSTSSSNSDAFKEETLKQNDKETTTNTTTSNSKGEENEESFEETVRRMKQDADSTTSTDNQTTSQNELISSLLDYYDSFRSNVSEAWQDLVTSGQPKDINKKLHVVHPTATAEGDTPYDGVVDIMVIDESEHLTAWERMQRRLTEAPIIQDILERGEVVYEKSGAKNAKERLDHLGEDAREAWETSQNPWVYRVSSVYDTLTAESDFAVAVRELRTLDPTFTLEEWKQDVVEHTLPQIMQWFLEGRINQLKPWLGEGVFTRIAAEITARQKEGVQIDTHVLGIMNSEILACERDEVNKGSPIILLHFMCQQINCVTKKKDGSVVEGSEDDIRANSYVCAFQREYDEEKGELNWKIVDFRFNGAIAYI